MATKGIIAGAAALATILTPVAVAPASSAAPRQPALTPVIVRLVAGSDAASVARGAAQGGGRVGFTYRHIFSGFSAALPAQAITALRRNPAVFSIETDVQAEPIGIQTGAVWGLDRLDQAALPLDGAFAYPDATAAVTSYIVDTGVLGTHTEFTGRTAPGFTAIADGNGTTDCNGHGTHVAGTVAGTTFGVAKTATVVPVRVLGCDGSGSYSGVIAGLDWITGHHEAGTPAVANLSLGGPASATLDAAIQRVIDDGVTVVVAAGNSNTDACTTSPARAPEAITVAASDSADARASFSNLGTCVDLFAPGVGIRSAWFTGSTATTTISGTSMASPHVAGAVALLLGQTPSLTPTAATTTVLSQSVTGRITNAGSGTPNRLLQVVTRATPPPPAATAPAAPTSVSASAGRRAATVSWLLGADGGSPLTGQTIYVYVNGRLRSTVPAGATATRVTVSGLKAGTTYTFRVTATNAVGTSPLSASSNAVTALR